MVPDAISKLTMFVHLILDSNYGAYNKEEPDRGWAQVNFNRL